MEVGELTANADTEPDADQFLPEWLFDQLCEMIVSGEIAPGQKLSEPKLAARFQVSRSSLREAIRRLEERQLIERKRNAGVRVIVPTRALVGQLFEIREVLEGLAARGAAQNATDKDVAALHAMLDEHEARLRASIGETYWQSANSDFHVTITELSRNQHLFDMLCVRYYSLIRFLRRKHNVSTGRPLAALREHRRIVSAIEDRDPELAEMLMRRHVATARAKMVQNFPYDAGE